MTSPEEIARLLSRAQKRAPKPTPAMMAALKNLADGHSACRGLSGRSAYGGFERTRLALVKRGWMTVCADITDAGRAAIASASATQEGQGHG